MKIQVNQNLPLRHARPTLLRLLFGLLLLLALGACDSTAPDTPVGQTAPASAQADTPRTVGQVISATANTDDPITALAATATAQTLNTPVPTPQAAALDPQAQHLTLRGGDDPQTLDPALAADSQSSFIVRQLFSGLVRLDMVGGSLQVVPDLAATLPAISDDGLTYTFIIRSGARFQDGTPITADDVRYSLERATDPALGQAGTRLPAATFLADIAGATDKLAGKASSLTGLKVVSPTTLQITLAAPAPAFLSKLSNVTAFVVSKQTVASGADWWLHHPNGSGPFALGAWVHQQSLTLVRNPTFYGGAAYLTGVTILLGDTGSDNLSQYQQGALDILDVRGNDAALALDKTRALNRDVSVTPGMSLTYLGFNTRQRPFDDTNVRLAFSLAVDRARIARLMFDTQALPARTILPYGLPGYTGNSGALTYDVSKARDLLAASSYKKPENLPPITLYTTDSRLSGALQAIFKDALNVGVAVRLVSAADFGAGLARRDFPMFIYSWTADYPDPQDFLGALFSATSPDNATGYSNKTFDDTLLAADKQTDPQQRLALYSQAEQIVLNDAPILPLLTGVTYELKKPYVKGLDIGLFGPLSLRRVYIDKGP